jgi:acetolactate synthase I/II/III large subunit
MAQGAGMGTTQRTVGSEAAIRQGRPRPVPRWTVSDELCAVMVRCGIDLAFGIPGGGVAPFWASLVRSAIRLLVVRHESSAAFAALGAYLENGRPAMAVSTAGPGASNMLSGILAASADGGKLIVVAPLTARAALGRYAIQETTPALFGLPGAAGRRGPFDAAFVVRRPRSLARIEATVAAGLRRPGRFVALVLVPTDVQARACPFTKPARPARPARPSRRAQTGRPAVTLPFVDATRRPAVSRRAVRRVARLLRRHPFYVLVGFGAIGAAAEILELVERTGAGVLCTPRGLAIFPPDHHRFVGPVGVGGRVEDVRAFLAAEQPQVGLVLGTRLGEGSTSRLPDLARPLGFVHVDLDREVFGRAYPSTKVVGVRADTGDFVRALLAELPLEPARPRVVAPGWERRVPTPTSPTLPTSAWRRPVRPQQLVAALQRVVLDAGIPVIADSGNSFVWAVHLLRPRVPGLVRVSTAWGAMGLSNSVLGAALARGGPAVALIGDAAHLMLSEVNTAATYRIPAIWVVMADFRLGMVEDGMAAARLTDGFDGSEMRFARCDFAAMARAAGAAGLTVRDESQLDAVLAEAVKFGGPVVVHVDIDDTVPAPIGGRVDSLGAQMAGK